MCVRTELCVKSQEWLMSLELCLQSARLLGVEMAKQ